MRRRGWIRPAGIAAALLAAAGCADFLAAPGTGAASLALALHPAGPAAQQSPGTTFDEVDGISLRVTRENAVVIDSTIAVTPAPGEIRRSFVVWMERDEEEVGLSVQLLRQGVAVFAGSRPVLLVRGRQTTAELVVQPVGATPAGAAPYAPPR